MLQEARAGRAATGRDAEARSTMLLDDAERGGCAMARTCRGEDRRERARGRAARRSRRVVGEAQTGAVPRVRLYMRAGWRAASVRPRRAAMLGRAPVDCPGGL